MIKNKIQQIRLHKNAIYREMLTISIIFFLFCIFATFTNLNNKSSVVNVVMWDSILTLPFLMLLFVNLKNGNLDIDIKEVVKRNKLIIILMGIVILMRIWQIGTIPRWDSEAYFHPLIEGCKNFKFTGRSFIDSFMLASHQCVGYSLFIAIGCYATPYNIVGVNIVNLILYCFYVYCLYKIFKKIFSTKSDIIIFVATLLVTFEPMQLGTFSHLNLDYPLLIFMIYICYCHLSKKYILMTFFIVVVIGTKETGIVLILGYFLGMIFFSSVKNRINENRIMLKKVIFSPTFWCFVFGGGIFLLYKVIVRVSNINKNWGNGVKLGSSGLEIKNNYFALDWDYIILKLKTIFGFNCYWIASLLIIFIGIYMIISIIRNKKSILIDIPIMAYFSSAVAMLLFDFLFITYNNPRYNLILENALFILLAILVINIEAEYVRCCIIIVCSIWFIVESYTTIDPISGILFKRIYTGNQEWIVHPVWDNNPYLADTSVYNNQSDYLDKAYNKVLEEVDYNSNMDILIPGEYTIGVRAIYLEGRYMQYYWNREKKERTLKKDSSTIPIQTLNDTNFNYSFNNNNLKPYAVAIFTPQYGIDEEKYISLFRKYYDISERKSVSIFAQGKIIYYKLKLKNNLKE